MWHFQAQLPYNRIASVERNEAMSSVSYSVRIDQETKKQAEAIFAAMGQTLSSAINAFLLQSIRVGGFPFEMKLTENQRATLLAKLESDEMLERPEEHNFRDVEDVIADLNA